MAAHCRGTQMTEAMAFDTCPLAIARTRWREEIWPDCPVGYPEHGS